MITSVKNEKVKNWKKLHHRKNRMKTNSFLIDGFHLIQEALHSDWTVKELIIEEGFTLPSGVENIPMEFVTENVMREISQTQTPQGIIAVVEIKEEKNQRKGQLVILLDAIQDPGNLGTIIRTADAAGVDAVILGEGCVDLYNDKVIRATQGSLFHLPINISPLEQEIHTLKTKGFTVLATALQDAVEYTQITSKERVALVLGNEGAGVSPEILQMADQRIHIPIYGKAESLNVGIASGILMYHFKQ